MDTWKCQIRKGGFTFSCGKDGNFNDPKLWLLQKINDTYPAHQEVWENRHLHLQQPKINTQKNNKELLIIFIQSQDIPSGVLHDNKIDLL